MFPGGIGQSPNMVSPAVVVLLGLVASTYTAPESKPNFQIDLQALGDADPEQGIKAIETVSEDMKEDIGSKDIDGPKNTLKDIIQTAVKTGQLDRGFVSDLINSTLSRVQMGISLENKNGTSNQLCIKLGNVNLGGCHRTAVRVKDISSDHNRTQIPPEVESRPVE